MVYKFRFQKIIDFIENEKQKTLVEYEQAVQEFERVATKLYECLKKKEELEAKRAEMLHDGLSIQEMRHHQQFVANLDQMINHYQKLVMLKRHEMNEKQALLTDQNIEFKKYEKMKEKDYQNFLLKEKTDEMKELDQISLTGYTYRRN
ncbi:flagellar export protein FliJ [Aeribacillus alveayuensis]|uniref:Flagellar FliJ protein n=1 Tax=Aeribacillus alveayuensis TaxID=279215 RepID=A0ABT9VL89_9BACI|nr:flagellar FliJ protein [Bacillus alveayuensis]